MRARSLTLFPLGATATGLSIVAIAQAAPAPLVGTVGPGFTITLTDKTGKPVSRLKPGSYTIVVHDKSPIHNFHLGGPGVDKTTSVTGQGTTTWTVQLVRGRYHFQCDPHATIMKGNVSVG